MSGIDSAIDVSSLATGLCDEDRKVETPSRLRAELLVALSAGLLCRESVSIARIAAKWARLEVRRVSSILLAGVTVARRPEIGNDRPHDPWQYSDSTPAHRVPEVARGYREQPEATRCSWIKSRWRVLLSELAKRGYRARELKRFARWQGRSAQRMERRWREDG